MIKAKVTDKNRVSVYGDRDNREIINVNPYGFSSVPDIDLIALLTSSQGKKNIFNLGVITDNSELEIGQTKIYNSSSAYALFDKDIIELNGNTDFAVKFSELKKAFDELTAKVNDLITKYNTHTHTTPSGPSSPTTTTETATTVNIDSAKNEKVKI